MTGVAPPVQYSSLAGDHWALLALSRLAEKPCPCRVTPFLEMVIVEETTSRPGGSWTTPPLCDSALIAACTAAVSSVTPSTFAPYARASIHGPGVMKSP